jgi:hypothetical protein
MHYSKQTNLKADRKVTSHDTSTQTNGIVKGESNRFEYSTQKLFVK